MEKLCLLLLLLPLLILPVRGAGLEEVRDQMPESVQEVTTDLGDSMVSSSSRSLLEKGVGLWRQHLRESCKASLSILAVCVLLGLGQSFAGASGITLPGNLLSMAGVCAVALIALAGTGSLLAACQEALEEMDALLKGMMPAFVSAMAASGNPVSSVMASSATLMGAGLLLSLGKNLVFPAIRLFIILWAAGLMSENPTLQKAAGFLRWLCFASFKILLIGFTMYITMSGVMSSGADAAAVKAARVTISGVVPVLGSILSDASDTLLTGARVLKNGVGVFGMIAAVAVCLSPFIRCLCFSLVYKVMAALGHSFSGGTVSRMLDGVGDAYATALGLLGSCCALVFISMVVCTAVVNGT